MKTIRTLESMGYHFRLAIDYDYNRPAPPPPEAAALLAELSARKSEAISYLTNKSENIKTAEPYKSAIAKGLYTGDNPYTLLLTAVECISRLTADKAFRDICAAGITAVRGVGLEEPQALEFELAEVRKRIAMLTRPELNDEPTEARRDIIFAVRRHRELESRILAALGIKQ